MAYSRLGKLWEYLLPHKQKVIQGVLALLVVNAIGVYIPLLIKQSIDQLRTALDFSQIAGYVILLVVLACGMWAIRMASRMVLFGVGREVEFDLKQKIFEHLLKLEPAYFATNTSGDLINRATSDVDNIRRLLGFAILSLANTLFAYSLTLPVMLSLHVPLTLFSLSVYPLMLIVVQLFSGKLRDQQLELQESLDEMSELIQEDISGMALIKIYAQEENQREAFRVKNHNLLQANLKLAKTRNLLFPLIEGLAFISLLVLLWQGVEVLARGEISVGDFVALILYLERLIFPTALLGFTISAYQRGEVSVDRVEAILQAKPRIQDNPSAIHLPKSEVKGEISVKDLSFNYPGSKNLALEHISFHIKPGETVAIVGSVGSGKSTLANVLVRLLEVEPERVFLDGKDITEVTLDDLRKAIAYVPQESFLFSSTIRNNIRYTEPLAEQSQVEYYAQRAQIHPEILNFPQQYDTIVGERGITLSGGQRQRTSLARAMLLEAPVLILDDALSSVDNQTATNILQQIAQEKNKTVIFITHQLSAASSADRLLVMDKGRILQQGTHEELLESPGLYQSLWQQHRLQEILQ